MKRIRLEKRLSQEQFAERSGFTQQYLSDLERGRRNPTVVTLFELSQALGVEHLALVRPDDEALAEKARRSKPETKSRSAKANTLQAGSFASTEMREALARNLRKYRQAQRLSQEEVAHRAEIDRTYVSALERGVYAAGIDVVDRLARVLGVEAADLLRSPSSPSRKSKALHARSALDE